MYCKRPEYTGESQSCFIYFLAQPAIFVSSPGPFRFCFASAFWNDRNKLEYFLKEKRLTGLYQNQNFGQVALELYFAEALSNLPQFGSEQTMKMNTTSQLEWNSSHAGELISQCAFRKGKCIQNLQFLKYKLNQEEI